MGSITKLYPKNAAENPDNVLEQAIGNYESVFVIGFDKEGVLDARASLNIEAEEVIYMLEKFKYDLISGAYSNDTQN